MWPHGLKDSNVRVGMPFFNRIVGSHIFYFFLKFIIIYDLFWLL